MAVYIASIINGLFKGDKGRCPLTPRASGARLDRALYFALRLGHTTLFSPPYIHKFTIDFTSSL